MRRSFDPLPRLLSSCQIKHRAFYMLGKDSAAELHPQFVTDEGTEACVHTVCPTKWEVGNAGKGIPPIGLVLCKADLERSLSSVIQIPATSLLNIHPSFMKAKLFAFEAYLCFCLPPTWEGCSSQKQRRTLL